MDWMIGAAWAARKDIIRQAAAALNEMVEQVTGEGLNQGPIMVRAKFDAFNLDLEVSYAGQPMAWPGPEAVVCDPSVEVAEARPDLLPRLLIQRLVDRVGTGQQNGRCLVRLHHNH